MSDNHHLLGGHYEVTGSTVTKYYLAGTSRIATLAPALRLVQCRCG
ncbi:MAG: hypothetical protein HZB18_05025 [Chloroflexi bacterium]|nr:hypothetical protein [Chloroflexota bacterium]